MTRTASDDSGLVTTFDHKGMALRCVLPVCCVTRGGFTHVLY